MISQEHAKLVLEGLRAVQYSLYPYDEFIRIMKKRIMRYTGNTKVMFFNERKLVIELGTLGVLQQMNATEKEKAGSI